MNRIVIATDGSPDAAAAVDRGLELAEAFGAPVTFVYARTTPATLLGEPYYQRALDREVAHGRKVAREALELAAEAGVDADSEILDGGPGEAIEEVARGRDADLIVVGSRGLGALQGALYGSVSRWLVAHAERPVLVVKTPKEAPVRA